MSSLKELAVALFEAGAVRLGDIEAKLGRRTPIYFDLRVVVSHPKVMISVAQQLQKLSEDIHHDLLCGVPYAALPIAAVMSINTDTPMIMKRKETKLYGTKKMLEGKFENNQRCLVVEDVVTSGGSLMETVCTLRAEGLNVTDAVVVLDREQGGVSVLKKNGITVTSIFTLTDLLKMLNEAGKISDETVQIIVEHIKECQFSNLDFMKDNLELIE
ncbi:uridine 5'-monophosphate synthase-like isoform X2 [Trichoplusia ni]|nr:uridine 5'-monophosphate synthase-like isoform X2 [Trichoplusia ni]XP_026728580.1 uridine 5'-monophosphate synthase-like isoform X2 [Trichoplusia ni]XP_026728581.1 uridine 5'-monophosphate synthase-like isoform X2 [Trichoplusia ni]XP_026728582.1 uridine 5'-monophosphate synthase-like isoform X2 [Trichoplusia ni]